MATRGQAWPGAARRGMAWLVEAWPGGARQGKGITPRRGDLLRGRFVTRRGEAWHGKARRGKARQGHQVREGFFSPGTIFGGLMDKRALDRRQVRREREILGKIIEQFPMIKKRSVPVSLFKKLLDAADWALGHGYDGG